MSPITIEITTRGEVGERVRALTREKLNDLDRIVKGPILAARVVLIHEPNPRISLPARAEAEVDLQGRLICARASAPAMEAAVTDLSQRLHRQLRRYVERMITREHQPAEPPPGEWSHRAWSPPRPPVFVRPAEDRQVMRRPTYAFGPMSPQDAAEALEDLDHEFLLFHDADTDADAVLYRRDDGRLGLIEPGGISPADGQGPVRVPSRYSGPVELDAAVEEMDAVDHRFLYFENAATGRGNVIYRRYDGHYGVVEP